MNDILILVSQDTNIQKDINIRKGTNKNPTFLYSMPFHGVFKPLIAPCLQKP
jgi:hypothetical protein